MMAIYSDRNLYPGINPHLNSFLQQDSWESFHAKYITLMATELDQILPANYYADAERSLQISEIGIEIEQRRTRPDVTIYQTHTTPGNSEATFAATLPSITLPLADVLEDEDDYLTGIIIYEVEGGNVPGKPVTRIEVLSPANKPPQSYYRQYMARRLETLRGGLTLVEIDFLHESRPIIGKLPSYPDAETGAFPYTIVVSDPHPRPEDGHMHIFGVGVLDRLPIVRIPLAGTDEAVLDFGLLYNRLFESSRLYRMVVDYEQEPVSFDHYLPADQEHIRQHMAKIREAQHNLD